MTTTVNEKRNEVRARPSGFFRDLLTVSGRALRAIPREPETFIPALFIPAFFFIVNVGALQDLTENFPGNDGFDYRAFQLPTAIIFAWIFSQSRGTERKREGRTSRRLSGSFSRDSANQTEQPQVMGK